MSNANQGLDVVILHIKSALRWLRRSLHMSPIQALMRDLKRRGFDLRSMDALECFAFTGKMHTIEYGKKVRSLTLWEITAGHEQSLRKTFPGATVRITDTYQQVLREENTFDLIVVDNSPTQGEHFESFDLFPAVFRLAKRECILLLNVLPEINASMRKNYPRMTTEGPVAARRRFYGTPEPEHIPLEVMVKAYERIAREEGFEVKGWSSRRRNDMVLYLMLHVSRVLMITGGLIQMLTTHGFLGA